jgi:RimJ/RimL family protein N-acetyltransferase
VDRETRARNSFGLRSHGGKFSFFAGGAEARRKKGQGRSEKRRTINRISASNRFVADSPKIAAAAPVIETERLLLRRMTPADADALFAVLGDPVSMKYYPDAFSRDDVNRWIAWSIASYDENGYGLYAMTLKSTGAVIGDCGHVRQNVDGAMEIEIGYHVLRALQGQGYATEAARACVEYGFAKLGAKRLISLIRPENLASRRVAEKSGMTIEKEIVRKGFRHFVYSIARPA